MLVLTGPSGAGKSRLARRLSTRYGWPVVELDDFYLEGSDPRVSRPDGASIDWDHVRTWDRDSALDALRRLCTDGVARMPVYDISASAITGDREVCLDHAPVVIAEGVFAAHIIGSLREHDMLVEAWCIHGTPWATFWRRLVRDVREHRKPLSTLWRRGLQLRRAEAGIVMAQQALGAVPMRAAAAEERARIVTREAARRGRA